MIGTRAGDHAPTRLRHCFAQAYYDIIFHTALGEAIANKIHLVRQKKEDGEEETKLCFYVRGI